MPDFIDTLLEDPTLAPMVRHRRSVDGTPAAYALPQQPPHPRLAEALDSLGIDRLFTHQARTLDLARTGRNVLIVTPTASGKTLCFASAVFDTLLEDRRGKALFLYPTKALAQDQVAGLRDLAAGTGALDPPRLDIYDGDTPPTRRARIRADPPELLLTNPDMLHFGILGHHQEWAPLLADLRWIVLDELHVYRGLFGSHVHHILRRLRRLCAHYGSRPQFLAASATIGNPKEFSETLVGEPFEVIDQSGAPRSGVDAVFLNPAGVSPYTTAVRVLSLACAAGLKTIAFAKARRVTELLYTWLLRQHPELAGQIAPYRAGYLPHERRAIEARLFRGELSAVLTTSALELGIDVGALDLCVLIGYPGSLMSSWQRIGRVGRSGRRGQVVMIAYPDALDQYVVRHPESFFDGRFERVVVSPDNDVVAGRHAVCAAAEMPLERGDVADWPLGPPFFQELCDEGRLVQSAEGDRWFSFRRNPQRDVRPRSAATSFQIVEGPDDQPRGTIDGMRVYHECHPGAIYLHGGRSYLVRELDVEKRRVRIEPARADYYTTVLGDKQTEILERRQSRTVGEFPVGFGRLRVTVQIREYQRRRIADGEPVAQVPLDVPPLIYETVGLWIEMPEGLPAAFEAAGLRFMGGIHAAEHAAIHLFPLLAIADSGDVGGISYTGHPQLQGPAVFLYDGVPGGAGLARRAFADLPNLLERTLNQLEACGCEEGCPGCIHSPRCGNGNKPLHKLAAQQVIELWLGRQALADWGVALPLDSRDEPLRSYTAVAPPSAPGRGGVRRAGNVGPVSPTAEAPVERVASTPITGEAAAAAAVSAPSGGVSSSRVPPTRPSRAGSPGRGVSVAGSDAGRPRRVTPAPGAARGERAPGFFDDAEPPARSAAPPEAPSRVDPPEAVLREGPVEPLADHERVLVFDLETQRGAAEVGGWHRASAMGLALAVTYDPRIDRYTTYHEGDVERLMLDLVMADRVVGFNIERFDLPVLAGYGSWDLSKIRTLDLLGDIHRRLGFRISLGRLAQENLGVGKSADGLQSLRWWREGRVDLIEEYCRRDVEVTHRLLDLGRRRGYLLYRDAQERSVRLPVRW